MASSRRSKTRMLTYQNADTSGLIYVSSLVLKYG